MALQNKNETNPQNKNSMKALKDIPAESYKKCMQNWKPILKSIIKIGIHICKNVFFLAVRVIFDQMLFMKLM